MYTAGLALALKKEKGRHALLSGSITVAVIAIFSMSNVCLFVSRLLAPSIPLSLPPSCSPFSFFFQVFQDQYEAWKVHEMVQPCISRCLYIFNIFVGGFLMILHQSLKLHNIFVVLHCCQRTWNTRFQHQSHLKCQPVVQKCCLCLLLHWPSQKMQELSWGPLMFSEHDLLRKKQSSPQETPYPLCREDCSQCPQLDFC